MPTDPRDAAASVVAAARTLTAGGAVVLHDDARPALGALLVRPAATVSADDVNFMARACRGLVALALDDAHAARLGLSTFGTPEASAARSPWTVTIEARDGVTTGISAHDRALTIRVAAAAEAVAHDVVRPGHVHPLRAARGGTLERAGRTEAAVDLMRLAGARPAAAVACAILDADGEVADAAEVARFCDRHGLAAVTVAAIRQQRIDVEWTGLAAGAVARATAGATAP